MWRMQFLDESTLLIKFGKLDCVVGKVHFYNVYHRDPSWYSSGNIESLMCTYVVTNSFLSQLQNSRLIARIKQHSLYSTTFTRRRFSKFTTMHPRNSFDFMNHGRISSVRQLTRLQEGTNGTTHPLAQITSTPRIIWKRHNTGWGTPVMEGMLVCGMLCCRMFFFFFFAKGLFY